MKDIWNLINTSLILLVAIYIMCSRDINTRAYDTCEDLRKEVELQKERCDNISELVTKKDTIVVNITNYNRYYNGEKK